MTSNDKSYNDLVWRNKVINLRFYKKKLIVVESGLVRTFMFIVLKNRKKKKMKVTGYSMYFFKHLNSREANTLDFHAKVIVLFLNYIFFDKYDDFRLRDISDLKIEYGDLFLRDYSQGKLGNNSKTKETVEKVENVLTNFYYHLSKHIKLKYINHKDFHIYPSGKYFNNISSMKKEIQEVRVKSIFTVDYPVYTPPERIKYIPTYVLSEILKICDDINEFRQLKLAICLQAFGGLRRGEVCNVSSTKISYKSYGKDIAWFSIDLREKTILRDDGIDVGEIKKSRIQPIHPVFLSVFQEVYYSHLNLIAGYENAFGAMFLNRNGNAMTVNTYAEKFNKIIDILIERLSKRGSFKYASEAKLLMSGPFSTHVLRHYFTQFIAELEITRSPIEIAYWRGDSSLDSAIAYFTQNPLIDEKINIIQERVLNGLV